MATAIIGGLLQKGWKPDAISVVEIVSAAREKLTKTLGIRTFPGITADALNADCIVLAIKPQQMRDAATTMAPLLGNQLVISIAAGIRCSDLSRWLHNYPRIVRVMPNTPALVLAGISGLFASSGVSNADKQAAENILGAVGATVWVNREEDLDAVTAVSGSGPAYVFYFIEALEQAAIELKLSPENAKKLALETFLGAAKLALQSDDPVATLRAKVTSKGGTTERALKSMDEDRIKDAIIRAVKAAAERSRELGDELGNDLDRG